MQRLDAGTEFLVSVSSSSSSSSPPSVDGIGVEANADRLDALEDGDMHLLRRVAGSGECVSGVIWYVGVPWKASVAWVVFCALRGGGFMMAKLVADAIGGTQSCDNRKSGSVPGDHGSPRSLADGCGPQFARPLPIPDPASMCSHSGNMSLFFSDSTYINHFHSIGFFILQLYQA